MNKDFKMTATTLFGLESVLADELRKLGAQEVKEAIDKHPELKDGFNMWSEESTLDGRQRVAEDALVPMLVKAIQELKAEIDELKKK